jgi:Primosomal protein N'' (replication factor Y) - superfamily II helicase
MDEQVRQGVPAAKPYLRLAFPLPLEARYWYKNSLESPAGLGYRAEAFLGRRKSTGFVVEEADSCPLEESLLKSITRSIDKEPLFDASTVALAQWLSTMYFCSLGEALGAMLPSGRRESSQVLGELEDLS